jgi:hypothetical protein
LGAKRWFLQNRAGVADGDRLYPDCEFLVGIPGHIRWRWVGRRIWKRVSGGVMDLQTVLPLAVLIIGCAAYVFWPQERVVAPVEKTRLDYLRERKSVVYDNLRDLNFEFRAGKFPEEDYARQRGDLEAEAAKVVTEMETLGG